jgi:hypothetical protein
MGPRRVGVNLQCLPNHTYPDGYDHFVRAGIFLKNFAFTGAGLKQVDSKYRVPIPIFNNRLTKPCALPAGTEWYKVYANNGNVNNLLQQLQAIVGAFPLDNLTAVDNNYTPDQVGYWEPLFDMVWTYKKALTPYKI